MALTITLRVTPSSGRNAWLFDKQQRLKLYVKSPAEHGLANREVVKTIAGVLGITQDKISIIAGQSSRTKIVKIDAAITLTQFLSCIGVGHQQSLL